MTTGLPIIVFDGVCNFCNASVQFVIRHDRAGYFRFAPLQSAAGTALLVKFGIDPAAVTTFLLVDDGHAYVKSAAALRIATRLSWPWRALAVFKLVPRPMRDVAYEYLARHRYRWFGKRDACMVPTVELRERFLE